MIHFLAFSLRRALEGFRRNAVTSFAATITMVLMLLLLAGLVIILSGLQAGLQFIEQKVEVQAEISEGVTPDRVAALQTRLAALPEVAAVTHTTKEQALEEFRQRLRAEGQPDLTPVTGTNPLPARLNIKLRDPRVAGAVITTLNAPPRIVSRVEETQKQRQVESLLTITGALRLIGLAVVGVVGLTVLLIVVNTIRLAVMARADEIEIMRLVGASDAFIRWPFVFEGLLVGLLGAALTLGLLTLAAGPIGQLTGRIAGQVPVGFNQQLSQQVAMLVLAAGLALGGLGAYISVRTYLRR
jgi:cell division transport system permease protein